MRGGAGSEDRAEGVQTIVVTLGLSRSMALAALLAALGGAGLLQLFGSLIPPEGRFTGILPLTLAVLAVTQQFVGVWVRVIHHSATGVIPTKPLTAAFVFQIEPQRAL